MINIAEYVQYINNTSSSSSKSLDHVQEASSLTKDSLRTALINSSNPTLNSKSKEAIESSFVDGYSYSRSSEDINTNNFVVFIPVEHQDSIFSYDIGSVPSNANIMTRIGSLADTMRIRIPEVSDKELYLLVNPESFEVSGDKSFGEFYTRKGGFVEWYGSNPLQLSVSGMSGGFYHLPSSGQLNSQNQSGGYGFSNYMSTLSFKNIFSLVTFYKNNGFLRGKSSNTSTSGMSRDDEVIKVSVVEILYKRTIYRGSFLDMGLSFSDGDPSKLTYTFNFQAFQEVRS